MTELREFVIDGSKISSIQGFLNAFGNVLTPDTKSALATNLDAFNDVLCGGFGTPDEGFILRWRHSETSRNLLGYKYTVRMLRQQAKSCTAEKRDAAQQAWSDSKKGHGSGDFDMLVEIIREHGPGGSYSEDNVHLILE